MKINNHIKHGLVLGATLAFLFACGGGDSKSTSAIVAFGDSLTDGGTYKNGYLAPSVTIAQVGGGRFTTNGTNAKTWAEVLASGKGLSLTIAGGDGFSQTYAQAPGGLNYAQGGSRVKLNPGIGNNGTGTAASAVDVTTQVNRYLAANGSFTQTQLVLLSAGANDVFYATDPSTATSANPQPAIVQAANDLATLAQTMQAKGAVRLAVVNLPNMGKTLAAVGNEAALTGLSQLFNATLKSKLDALGVQYVMIDSYTWINDTLANAASYGITNTTSPACLANPYVGGSTSSLFCSPATFATPTADMTYAFADGVHPTTKMHQLYGAFALKAVLAAGW